MGLDASVRCNCWEQGIAVPPALKPLLRIDEQGYLDLPPPHSDDATLRDQFHHWMRSACPHEEMNLASERISNWGGLRSFQDTLRALGAERFPALLRELDADGGLTGADAARPMLAEIEQFASLPPFGRRYVLLDTLSGAELFESIDPYEGVFHVGPDGFQMGIDRDGFFIKRIRTLLFGLAWERTLFRSKRFEQQLRDPDAPDAFEQEVTFRASDGASCFTCRSPVIGEEIAWPDGRMENDAGQSRFHYPTRMHCVQRVRAPAQFTGITEPLAVLCRAAIESGNPIRWS